MTASRSEDGLQLGGSRPLCADTGSQERAVGVQQVDLQMGDGLPDGGANDQPDAAEPALAAGRGVGGSDALHDAGSHRLVPADGVLDGGPLGIGGERQDEDAPPARLRQVQRGGEGAVAQVG